MKKLIKTLFILAAVIILICLGNKLGILDFSDFRTITEEEMAEYTGYYYNQLTEEQKKIYIKIDRAVQENDNNISLGEVDMTSIQNEINKILTSYFNDNPRCFKLSSEYAITTRNFVVYTPSTLKIKYLDQYLDEKLNQDIDKAIDEMVKKVITPDMTDLQKELALHDELAKTVDYYDYDDISNIPDIKHTAYGALVEKEAVCDGISKAFILLLEKVGIESIIINGTTDKVSHAWNLVKLEDNYYHVDATSDNVKVGNNKYIIHAYFNLSDENIKKTHIISGLYNYPKCNAEDKDYYAMTDRYLSYEDNLYVRLNEIVRNSSNTDVLEMRVDSRYYTQSLIDALYDLDFGNWKSQNKTKIQYNKVNNIYIFVK